MKSEENLLKILIVEPSVIIRSGLSVALKRMHGYWIQPIEINSIENLDHILDLHKPDMLVINPSFWGFVDMTKVRTYSTDAKMKIVALTSSAYSEVLLKKYDEEISIHDTVEQIKEKVDKLYDEPELKEDTADESDVLSTREKEILVLVVKGMTNKEIAQTLFLSTHTIITHRRNIARKLEIHSAAGLTVYAIVNKLVELDEIKSNFTL